HSITSITPLFLYADTATSDIYTLSLHDALPIYRLHHLRRFRGGGEDGRSSADSAPSQNGFFHWSGIPIDLRHLGSRPARPRGARSEEHTSELQSLRHLVCRLLLEKKKK